MNYKIAWRNIWRNPRRTIIIMIAVVIGVWNMIFLGALMRGFEVGMINNGISTLTGNIQVHHKDYRNDPIIENSMNEPEQVEAVLEKTCPPETGWTSRIRINAVASNARHSGGITLVGIDPRREAKISFIGQAVTQGQYLAAEDTRGILVGKALVDNFKTKIGHKLVLMAPTLNGEIVSRAFRIVGIYSAEMQATEKRFVFISMASARQMLKLEKGVSEISIALPNHNNNAFLANKLQTALSPDTYEVRTWREVLPVLNAYLELSDGYILIWYVVVFIAMGFGIVNTTLMAVFERMREFGLLKALGMKPWLIIKEVLTESFLLLAIGTAVGNLLGFLSVLTLADHGIDLSALAAGAEYAGISRMLIPAIYPRDVITANLVVFVLGLLVSLYPAVKAAGFTPVEALSKT
ncbi:MAG: ABC transporter permease [Proteobacteria bacterium]|nr:ABC transporter permease [Pseudomonadota bacterium]